MRVAYGLNGNVFWWKEETELTEEEKELFNLIYLTPTKLLIDIEDKSRLNEIIQKLRFLDILNYQAYATNSPEHDGLHFEMDFPELENYLKEERHEIRKNIINDFNADVNVFSENRVYAKPNKPHWKGDGTQIKTLIKEVNEGENKLLEKWKVIPPIQYEEMETVLPDFSPKKCLILDSYEKNEAPEGERHVILSRNHAVYVSDKKNKETKIRNYMKTQTGSEKIDSPYQSQLDGVKKGINKSVCCGELINYNLKYNIPIPCGECEYYKPSLSAFEKQLTKISENELRKDIDKYLQKILKIDSWLHRIFLITNIAFKIKINKGDLLKRLKELEKNKEIKEPTSISQLLEKEIPKTEYWLKPYIPKNCTILVGGKAGTGKSLYELAQGLALITSKRFLDTFEIENKPKILYYDLENGEPILWWRLKYLLNGLNIDLKGLDDLHFEFSFNKQNIKKELELSKKYDIIIFDSYRRFLEGSENESDITNKFFETFLTPLKKENKTLIIIHHFKKSKIEELTDEDIVDLFRGSSDISAEFDLIYGIFKSPEVFEEASNTFNFDIFVTKVKNRLGLPIQNFSFKVTKDDNNIKTLLKFSGHKRFLSPSERAKDRILELLKINREVTRDEIIKSITQEIQCSKDSVIKYLSSLYKDKAITKTKYGVYSLFNDMEVGLDDEKDPQTKL